MLLNVLAKTLKHSGNAQRTQRRSCRPELEALEDRQLMACTVTRLAWDPSIIQIVGTNRGDSVDVSVSGTQVVVRHLTPGTLLVPGDLLPSYAYFDRATVSRVYFEGRAGNDSFTNRTTLFTQAYGDDGNDTLQAGSSDSALDGGNGADLLVGGSGSDHLFGGAGNDSLTAGAGQDTVYAGGDDDTVYGGSGNDTLNGEGGIDRIYGSWGNDKIYGGGGYDYLFGEDGNDFLDPEADGADVNGGSGYDINAQVWIVGGLSIDDVTQGFAPTCWFHASLASVAEREPAALSSRISYVGRHTYRVFLYNPDYSLGHQDVFFNGDVNSAEMLNLKPGQEGEFWTVIWQRAYLQSRGLSISDPPGGWPTDALLAMTGRTSYEYWVGPAGILQASDLTRIMGQLAAGKNVVACTWGTFDDFCSPRLAANHCYTVLSVHYDAAVGDYVVTLRNPWGYDGGARPAAGDPPDADPNDAIIQLRWLDFAWSMVGYCVN